MEKGSKITSYVKNAMESLMFGVAKSVVGSDIVAPALAPVPIDDIDASYGSVQEIEKPKEEEGKKYEEIIVERIEEGYLRLNWSAINRRDREVCIGDKIQLENRGEIEVLDIQITKRQRWKIKLLRK